MYIVINSKEKELPYLIKPAGHLQEVVPGLGKCILDILYISTCNVIIPESHMIENIHIYLIFCIQLVESLCAVYIVPYPSLYFSPLSAPASCAVGAKARSR